MGMLVLQDGVVTQFVGSVTISLSEMTAEILPSILSTLAFVVDP